MPKIVDHEARRRDIARAVFALVEREGVSGASVRAVAAEGGWSMGAVRYYFDNQDDLLAFAVRVMEERVSERAVTIIRTTPPSIDRAEQLLSTMLPLDADRAGEVRIWAAFMTWARAGELLDEVRSATWQGERFLARVAAADIAGHGWPASVGEVGDPALEPHAERLHVLVDGLSIQGITHAAMTPDEQRRLLRAALRSG